MSKLKEVIISLTNRCNLKCRMCDIPLCKEEELTTQEWKTVIRDSSLIGAETVVFSGGEPMLRSDIFELIYFAKNNSLRVCLTSNGVAIDDKAAVNLRDAGVNVVNISIDGSRGAHDYLRGDGAFNKAVGALDSLHRHRIETTIASIISKYNYQELGYVVKLANEYKVTTIKFQPFSNIFLNGRKGGGEFLFSDIDSEKMDKVIEEIDFSCRRHGIATNPKSYLKNISAYLCTKNNSQMKGCNALLASCPINSRGNFYPCWVFVNNSTLIGNVKNNRLADLWNSNKRKNILNKINNDGCPGCMMSCYDDNFGKENIKETIYLRAAKIKNNGLLFCISCFLSKWQKKIIFYLHYRGRLSSILRKIKGIFTRKNKKIFLESVDKKAIEISLQEIETVEKIFEKEIKSLL